MVTTTNEVPVNILGYYDRNLLERAIPSLLYSLFGQNRPLPMNQGTRINFRRYGSLLAATTPLDESVTPVGKQLAVTDIFGLIDQYGDFVKLSDLLQMTVLDKIVLETQEILGEQAGDTIDQVHRAGLMAGTSVRFASDVADRGSIVNVITDADIDAVLRVLEGNNSKKIREIKVGGAKISTYPIRQAYIGITHTDMRQDIEDLAGFISVEEYSSQGDVLPQEIGATKNIRWLTTTNGMVWPDAGGLAAATPPLVSTTGTDADVYGTLILGQNAYGVTSLGKKGIQSIIKQLGSSGSLDPLNQRSSVGWKSATVLSILNDDFMVRIESGAKAL